MSNIIVLSSEADNPTAVGVTSSDITPEQAQVMCLAAARHFQDLAIEAEVQRRMAAVGEENARE